MYKEQLIGNPFGPASMQIHVPWDPKCRAYPSQLTETATQDPPPFATAKTKRALINILASAGATMTPIGCRSSRRRAWNWSSRSWMGSIGIYGNPPAKTLCRHCTNRHRHHHYHHHHRPTPLTASPTMLARNSWVCRRCATALVQARAPSPAPARAIRPRVPPHLRSQFVRSASTGTQLSPPPDGPWSTPTTPS